MFLIVTLVFYFFVGAPCIFLWGLFLTKKDGFYLPFNKCFFGYILMLVSVYSDCYLLGSLIYHLLK